MELGSRGKVWRDERDRTKTPGAGERTTAAATAAELEAAAEAPLVAAAIGDAEAVAAALEVADAVLDAAVDDPWAEEGDAPQGVRGPGIDVTPVRFGIDERGEPREAVLHHGPRGGVTGQEDDVGLWDVFGSVD